MKSWTYDGMEAEVRKMAHSLPPTDLGSARAIHAITHFVFEKFRELRAPMCRVCGCTNENACPGGCAWAEPDLCTACKP